MKRSCVRNNKGFSLVELIVIILIMGILTTGAAMSFSVVYNADAERAAKKIVSIMSTARTKAMALNSNDNTTAYVTFEIHKDADGNLIAGVYKYPGGEELEAQKISSYRVSISLAKKNYPLTSAIELIRANEDDPTEEVSAVYRFKKGTGGLHNMVVKSKDVNGTFTGEDNMYLDIVLSKGSDEQHIIIVPATGRCYLE